MSEYGGLPGPLAWVVHLLLVAVLALFVAAFGAGLALVARRQGPAALLVAPALWVTTELGRIYLFTGFPWVLLGYSQTPVLPVAQLASLAGVLGLSAFVALVNATLAYAVAVRGVQCTRVVAATAAVVLAALGFGAWRLHDDALRSAGTPLRVAAVQGNIAQDDKWDPALREDIVGAYLDLTREAAAGGARLIVWPEAATPFAFQNDPLRADAIRQIARDTGAHLLLGTTDVRYDGLPRYYNAAVMVDAAGETAGIYHKHHLVPFGEYVPWRRLLFFVSPLVESVGDFSTGPGTADVEHGRRTGRGVDLLRDHLSWTGARIRDAREPPAGDRHERCVVRTDGGAPSALPAGVHARNRAGALSRAGREHRNQRRRRSVRAGGGEHAAVRAAHAGRRRAADRRAHPLQPDGGYRGVRLRRDSGARPLEQRQAPHLSIPAARPAAKQEKNVDIALEERVRRYQDLIKRAADMRSYL